MADLKEKGIVRFGRTKVKRKWLFSLLSVIVFLFSLYITRPLYLRPIGHFFIVSDPIEKSDAIIVLDGDYPWDERLLHAIQLWQKGYAPVIILSAKMAGWQSYDDFPSWRHAMKLKIIPMDKLLVATHGAESTKGETEHLLRFVQGHGFRKVIIVTSNYHSRRAGKVFKKEWDDSGIAISVSPAYSSRFHPEKWWTKREDSKIFFYELSKTIWYFLKE